MILGSGDPLRGQGRPVKEVIRLAEDRDRDALSASCATSSARPIMIAFDHPGVRDELRPRLVVGADGHDSSIARQTARALEATRCAIPFRGCSWKKRMTG